jgi:hypothetical protein
MSMSRVQLWAFPLLAGLALAAEAGAAAVPAPKKPARTVRLRTPEAVEMALAILGGSGAGPGKGWFHPGQSRYDWHWLAGRMDANRDGVITRKEFQGPQALFDRLDRDGDGQLTPADLDWSAKSPLVQQARLAEMLFRRADADGDRRLSAKEWQALFRRAARGKDHLTPDDLRRLLFPPPPPPRPAGKRPGGGGPSPWTLLRGLWSGEIGSIYEGPAVGQVAPDFTLDTHDGLGSVSLRDYRGKKPVVLIFGSFT